MGRGDDRSELVKGWPAEEDVVGCVGVYDQVSDLEGFAGPFQAERFVQLYVTPRPYAFPREADHVVVIGPGGFGLFS